MLCVRRKNSTLVFGVEATCGLAPWNFQIQLKLGHIEFVICVWRMSRSQVNKAFSALDKWYKAQPS